LCVIKKPRRRGDYSPARGLQNTTPQWVVAPVEKKNETYYTLYDNSPVILNAKRVVCNAATLLHGVRNKDFEGGEKNGLVQNDV